MIKVIHDERENIIARTDVNKGMVNLSVGIGAYQLTEFSPEKARELALDLIMWADYIEKEKQK